MGEKEKSLGEFVGEWVCFTSVFLSLSFIHSSRAETETEFSNAYTYLPIYTLTLEKKYRLTSLLYILLFRTHWNKKSKLVAQCVGITNGKGL